VVGVGGRAESLVSEQRPPGARSTVYAVDLPIFEGPLDLLLHLVRRHELDILDIPISFVTQKYLEYLDLMRALDVEIAGEYLVMAATLAYLKSRELLPRQEAEGASGGEGEEDGVDPREALIRRLVEYQRFRAASAELDARPVAGRDTFGRGREIDLPPLDPGMAPVTLFRLAEAYARVLQRAKISKSHDVTIELVTVRQRMEQLSLMLDERKQVDFEGLFLGQTWRSVEELRAMLVVTLMSILELVKMGLAAVYQAPETTMIRIERRASHQQALAAIAGYDEEASFGEAGEVKAPVAAAGVDLASEADEEPGAAAPRRIGEAEGAAAATSVSEAAGDRAQADEAEDEEDEAALWEDFPWSPPATAGAPAPSAERPPIPWTEAGWEDDEEEAEEPRETRAPDDEGPPDESTEE
jgi:segregation and condensation protein A